MQVKLSEDQRNRIEFHADDYGMFPGQSRRILDCIENGACNGISLMANSPYLSQCMNDLTQCLEREGDGRRHLHIAVHLNLVHGKSLTPKDEIPLLVNDDGIFNRSFALLWLQSLIPGRRKQITQQVAREFRAQIRAAYPYMDPQDIRLDSHVHYHMIPVCFDALVEAISEEKITPSHIRIPRESIGLYLRHRRKLQDFKMINVIKVLLLNTFARRNLWKYAGLIPALQSPADFVGVMLSGRMTPANTAAILPDAASSGASLEVLFHPGAVYEEEDIRMLNNAGDRAFLTETYRQQEAQALLELKQA